MSPPAEDRAVEYDDASGTYHATFDIDTESPSVRLLEAVAAVRNEDPTELDPLDNYVDPDALNVIFEPMQSQSGSHGSFSFAYEGLLVLLHSDGEIELREQA